MGECQLVGEGRVAGVFSVIAYTLGVLWASRRDGRSSNAARAALLECEQSNLNTAQSSFSRFAGPRTGARKGSYRGPAAVISARPARTQHVATPPHPASKTPIPNPNPSPTPGRRSPAATSGIVRPSSCAPFMHCLMGQSDRHDACSGRVCLAGMLMNSKICIERPFLSKLRLMYLRTSHLTLRQLN